MGEEGSPGVMCSAAETQEVGQVRVVVGLCSRINSELLRSIPLSTYSSQANHLMPPMPPHLLMDQTSNASNPDLCGGADGIGTRGDCSLDSWRSFLRET